MEYVPSADCTAGRVRVKNDCSTRGHQTRVNEHGYDVVVAESGGVFQQIGSSTFLDDQLGVWFTLLHVHWENS